MVTKHQVCGHSLLQRCTVSTGHPHRAVVWLPLAGSSTTGRYGCPVPWRWREADGVRSVQHEGAEHCVCTLLTYVCYEAQLVTVQCTVVSEQGYSSSTVSQHDIHVGRLRRHQGEPRAP